MNEPTFAEKMVAKYESLLLEAAGLRSVTVEGQTVTYAQLLEEYRHWKREVLREKGQRPTIVIADMSGQS